MPIVKTPHLPQNKVTHMIVPRNLDYNLEDAFAENGINLLKGDMIECITGDVKYHIDMQIAHIGGNMLVCEPQTLVHYQMILQACNITAGGAVDSHYPGDCAYNVARVRGMVLCGKRTDHTVIAQMQSVGASPVYIRQGYTKCCCAIVSSRTIITSDRGIYAACTANGIKALLVSPGHVALAGFDYGFIGGACGKIAVDKLAFFGDLSTHPDAYEIEKFCASQNVEAISLLKTELRDIGSVIPILETE